MDIASPTVGFIGLANLVLISVSALVDFFRRIKEAPAYITAIQLELNIMQDLLLVSRTSYNYLQAAGSFKSLEYAIDISQSEVTKLERLIRRFYPELDLGGWEQKWSQVSVALRQKKLTKYHDGLRRARALLFTAQSYVEMPLRYHQYAMTKSLRNAMSDLAQASESTRAAVDLTNSNVLDLKEDMYRVSFNYTKIVGFISSIGNKIDRIDGDLSNVRNAAQRLLEFHTGFEDRLVQVLKPSSESAISDVSAKHLNRGQRTFMEEEAYLHSNSTTTNLSGLTHIHSLDGSLHLSALVETSLNIAAGTETWTTTKSAIISLMHPNQRRLSFGYLAIQSTRGIFYKIEMPYGPPKIKNLITTVILLPAECLYTEGALFSLAEFADGLNSPSFDFEVVPVVKMRSAYSRFSAFQAGDPESLVHLSTNLKNWLRDLSIIPETPVIISMRPSGEKHRQQARGWYLMQLLAQGMLSSGVEPFSPTVGLWTSLCPKERIIVLKAYEALVQKYPELWHDDSASAAPSLQDDHSKMQSLPQRDILQSGQLAVPDDTSHSAQVHRSTRVALPTPTQKPRLRRRDKRGNLRASAIFEARS